LHWAGIFFAKGLANLLWATAPQNTEESPVKTATNHIGALPEDPCFPPREVGWAVDSLAPYLVTLHDGDYVCIPAGRNRKASMAARALAYQHAATLISTQLPWSAICTNRAVADQLQRIIPMAGGLSWEVYRLAPDFAQAVRLELLATALPGTQPAPSKPVGRQLVTIEHEE